MATPIAARPRDAAAKGQALPPPQSAPIARRCRKQDDYVGWPKFTDHFLPMAPMALQASVIEEVKEGGMSTLERPLTAAFRQ